MKTSRFICCCAIVVIVSTAVGSTFADQSTKERIRIHKEWLARRAASRVNTNSTQRTTYLRKLIKFKNEHEPLSENDISFVPHFAHNNRDNEYHQEGGGGSGGTEGTRGDTVESRGELQQDSDNEYGLRPVGSVANPDDMSEQQSQADRYRYNVATGESNLPRPADGSVQSRLLVHHPEDGPEASNEIPLVTSTGGSSGASGVTQQRNDATVTSGGRGNESETPTERINAVAKINEPGRSGTVHGMNNDLQPLQVGATGSGTHKSDPGRAVVGDKRKSWHHSTIINNETTDDENSTSSYGGRAGFATTTGATPTTTAISKVALEGAKVDDHDRTKVDGNVTVRNGFGPWSNWTACSRSCGGGVKSQQRKCWRREYINGKKSPKPAVESHDCIGIVKRYHLCNEQDCPDTTVDFREQQCTSFNNQTFQDKRYIWEAFIKDDAECELNCKPIGMRYFATLNKTVIDGTPCRKPTEYFRRNNSGRGICVDGICKEVLVGKLREPLGFEHEQD